MTASSNDLWQRLGIGPTSDEKAIRRAYAQRLREVRPDDDPVGFQQLVEARDRALGIAQRLAGDELRGWRLPEHWTVKLQARVADKEGHGQPHGGEATPQPLHGKRTAEPRRPVEFNEGRTGPERDGSERTAILDLLDAMLRESDGATGPLWLAPHAGLPVPLTPDEPGKAWREIADRVARLSITDRAAVQPDLIRRLSAYVTGQDVAFRQLQTPNDRMSGHSLHFVDWPTEFWPFFTLVAQLDAEFGWRQHDRVIHLCLPRGDADRFMSLLAWAHDLNDIVSDDSQGPASGSLPHVRAIDLYGFYDGGRDHLGLRSFHVMRDQPEHWRASDAATDLFFPLWSLRDGRYLKAMMGLLGWSGLVAAYAPWRSPGIAEALPWIVPKADSVIAGLLDLWPLGLAIWLLLGTTNWKTERSAFFRPTQKGAELVDRQAGTYFPFWALARGLYVRGIIGILAWGAVLYHYTDFRSQSHLLSHPGPLLLAAFLHGVASANGQRWVVYKLLRIVKAADQAGLHDPFERLQFIRRRRTVEPKVLQKIVRIFFRITWGLIACLFVVATAFALIGHFFTP
jgi:hypothetical protein